MCVRLKLYDNKGKLLNVLQSDASDYSKWAIGWTKSGDTILLNSHDVGTYAYKVSSSKSLINIKVTPELQKSADSIFNKKYSN